MHLIKKIFRKLRRGYYTVDELRSYGMKIGENCHLFTNKIDIPHCFLIEIGNDVTISNARLLAHDGSTKRELGYSKVGRILIGNNVFIGADSIILPNVKIGDNVIIGAGAVVSTDIPENSVAVGVPARVVTTYDAYMEKQKALFKNAPVWDTHYSEKTVKEKEEMKACLMNGGIGFDH